MILEFFMDGEVAFPLRLKESRVLFVSATTDAYSKVDIASPVRVMVIIGLM